MNKKGIILPLAIMVGSAMIVAVFAYFTYVINTKENDTPQANNNVNYDLECWVTGCSNTRCVEKGEEVYDTCQIDEWFECYNYSTCEVQNNGQCGWTVTKEYDKCMREKNPNY